MVETVDLGIGWEWEHDADFVLVLDACCQRAGLTSYLVHPENLSETWHRIQNDFLVFRTFLDRASDNLEAAEVMVRDLKSKGTRLINDPDLLPQANDKATMHLELLTRGVKLPYTIILGPQEGNELEDVPELGPVGVPFIIKPANGGGGRGVILGAQGKVDVVRARKTLWGDKILLQEEIQPDELSGTHAWFRTFMVGQRTHLCWWDRETHLYREVSPQEEFQFGLEGLRNITKAIGEVCKLVLFSTEIAKTGDGRFVAVDYVNDQPDFRPQSKTPDGIPDQVLGRIVTDLVDWVKESTQEERQR